MRNVDVELNVSMRTLVRRKMQHFQRIKKFVCSKDENELKHPNSATSATKHPPDFTNSWVRVVNVGSNEFFIERLFQLQAMRMILIEVDKYFFSLFLHFRNTPHSTMMAMLMSVKHKRIFRSHSDSNQKRYNSTSLPRRSIVAVHNKFIRQSRLYKMWKMLTEIITESRHCAEHT